MGKGQKRFQWLVPRKLSHLIFIQAIFLLSAQADEEEGSKHHKRSWDTTTIEAMSETNYESLDEDQVADMRLRLENHLSKGAGIPVNEE